MIRNNDFASKVLNLQSDSDRTSSVQFYRRDGMGVSLLSHLNNGSLSYKYNSKSKESTYGGVRQASSHHVRCSFYMVTRVQRRILRRRINRMNSDGVVFHVHLLLKISLKFHQLAELCICYFKTTFFFFKYPLKSNKP